MSLEAGAVRVVAKTAPWLAPLPSGYFVGRSSYYHLLATDWRPLALAIAVIIGLVIELLGVATAHTILDLNRWNRQGRVQREHGGWEPAPVAWAWVSAVSYIVAVVLLLVVLEAVPAAARFAPVLFPLIAVSGSVLLSVIEQHSERKDRYHVADDLKSKSRAKGANGVTEPPSELTEPAATEKPFICSLCFAAFATQNALNAHGNAHRERKEANANT